MAAYAGNAALSLHALQEQVLASGDFLWMDDELSETNTDLVRPLTFDDLVRAKEHEEFWESGTHTILDVEGLIAADAADAVGTVRPLTPAELQECFGTDEPGVDAFERAWDRGDGPAAQVAAMPWAGRCAVLYTDAQPTHVAFWGSSGD